MGPRVSPPRPPRPDSMPKYERDGVIYPYDERVLNWSRHVPLEDLMLEDSPEPNDELIESIKASANKHFHLLQRREMPNWRIDSITMKEFGDDDYWGAAYPGLTLTELISSVWYNNHPEEMVTSFRPAGLFRKAQKTEFQRIAVPDIEVVEFRFECVLHTSPIKANYV